MTIVACPKFPRYILYLTLWLIHTGSYLLFWYYNEYPHLLYWFCQGYSTLLVTHFITSLCNHWYSGIVPPQRLYESVMCGLFCFLMLMYAILLIESSILWHQWYYATLGWHAPALTWLFMTKSVALYIDCIYTVYKIGQCVHSLGSTNPLLKNK